MKYIKPPFVILLLIGVLFFSIQITNAQSRISKKQTTTSYSSELHESVQYRSIGPFRGGRSAAVVGVANQPKLFYFGATGGGVWKTTDGGITYKNISFFKTRLCSFNAGSLAKIKRSSIRNS